MEKTSLRILQYQNIVQLLCAQTSTVCGKELASSLSPSDDFAYIEQNLSETAEAYAVLEEKTPPFGGIYDIRPLLKRVQIGHSLKEEELSQLQHTLYGFRQLKHFFRDLPMPAPLLKTYSSQLEILGNLENAINNIIDEYGAIRNTASVELNRLRHEIKHSQMRLKSVLDNILHNNEMQKYFQENIVTIRADRYVIPVKQEYRHAFPGIIHDQSASGSTLFIEPLAVTDLNNDIRQCQLSEKREIARILQVISAKVAREAETLKGNYQLAGTLDFIISRAKLAKAMHATRPTMNQQGSTDLKKVRHPLMEEQTTVPVDIKLGKGYRTLLITGPNTGGKTVTLKTLGLVVLMAQSGLFIPANVDSELAVYRNIFADIGDEQSIEQSLSTFSAHMCHIINIIDAAQKDDLILLDELGSGTDPQEGAALAMAILEQLISVNASIVATTHYNELKTFAYTHPNIENACVEFDIKTLRPTYRLIIGIPGASNAFTISSRLGLSEKIISRAKELVTENQSDFSEILNTLEAEKLAYEQKNRQLSEKEYHLRLAKQKFLHEEHNFKNNRQKSLQKTREDCAHLLRNAKREAESIIKTLKAQFNETNSHKRQQAIAEARQLLGQAYQNLPAESSIEVPNGVPIDMKKLHVGDIILVKNLQQTGNVVEIHDREIVVQLGSLKTTVKPKACLFISPAKSAPKEVSHSTVHYASVQKNVTIKRELDIRGLLVNEAEIILDKYLDDAILAGLKQVIVIHGKGTGALRKGIQEFLANNKHVENFQLAPNNEGGSGATVVTLRG